MQIPTDQRRPFPVPAALCVAALAFGSAAVGLATTYVMPTDQELLNRADLVVVASVEGVESAPDRIVPATDYQFRVERVLKGFVLATDIVVRVPGGLSDDDLYYRVHGAPEFDPSQRAILFLDQHHDHFRVVDMQLGAFLESGVGGTRLAVRRISASEIELPNDPRAEERARSHQPRAFDRFTRWLGDGAAGIERPADYFVEGRQDLVVQEEAFRNITFNCDAGPAIARWEQFDRGQRVDFEAYNVGQPGVPGGGFSQARRGLQAWNGVSGATVNLNYAGTTSNSSGGTGVGGIDEINRIIFDDPNDVIAGSFAGSGTLASTTVVADCKPVDNYVNGLYAPIVDADVVFQDNLDASFLNTVIDSELALERILTHELGHGIGLSHSCGDNGITCTGALAEAIMRADYVDSTLGRALGSDDRKAVRFTYPATNGGGNELPPPSALTATALSSSTIALEWIDNSTSEGGFLVQERPVGSAEWTDLISLAANSTTLLVEAIPELTARVYRVRAFDATDVSEWSNEAQATTLGPIGACVEDDLTLCLTDGRFAVTGHYTIPEGESGDATAVALTNDTGYFWFFNEENVEVVIKVLDACDPFDRFWIYAGGLTDVQVELTVHDTETGLAQTLFNPQGTAFLPVQDVDAFATCP